MRNGESATSYEKYVGGTPSPNPSYPQDIDVVTGENTINVLGKNICPDTFSKYTVFSPYTQYNLPIPSGTECIMSFTDNDTSIDISGCYIGFKDSGTGAPTSIRWCISNGSVLSNTTNIPSTGTDWCGTICIYPNTEEAFNKLFSRYKIQVEIGNTISNYISYKERQSYPINLIGKNLFNKDGVYEKGYYRSLNGDKASGENWGIYDVKIKSNTTYTLSGVKTNTGTYFCWLDENKAFISLISSKKNETITSPNNAKYISMSIVWNTSSSACDLDTFMLEEGSTASTYEAYHSIELAKIGTYKDKIYKDSGKWYIHKEIGKLILNGTESFVASSITGNFYRMTLSINTVKNDLSLQNTITTRATHFRGCTFNDRNTDYNNTILQISNGLSTMAGISIGTNIATTVSDFQTWLTTHNVVVYYILAIPTNTEITDENLISQLEAVKLLSGTQNNFTIDADTLPTLNLNYIGEANPHL